MRDIHEVKCERARVNSEHVTFHGDLFDGSYPRPTNKECNMLCKKHFRLLKQFLFSCAYLKNFPFPMIHPRRCCCCWRCRYRGRCCFDWFRRCLFRFSFIYSFIFFLFPSSFFCFIHKIYNIYSYAVRRVLLFVCVIYLFIFFSLAADVAIYFHSIISIQ